VANCTGSRRYGCPDGIEGVGRQLGGEEVIADEGHIGPCLLVYKGPRASEDRLGDVGPEDLACRPYPLAQGAQPPQDAAPHIKGALACSLRELREEGGAGRLPHLRLQLEPFELSKLARQQGALDSLAHGILLPRTYSL
jgi:hypothetical protein